MVAAAAATAAILKRACSVFVYLGAVTRRSKVNQFKMHDNKTIINSCVRAHGAVRFKKEMCKSKLGAASVDVCYMGGTRSKV